MPSVILLDVAGVVVGTLAGCGMKKYISGSLNESINLALSVISAAVGVGLLGKAVHMSAAVLALLIGGTIGHIIGIDRRLANVSKLLPETGGSETAQTLLVAFTLYCISTTGIIGALTLGFEGDTTVLMTKAIMDCVASIFFAGSSGWVLALISIPLGIMLMAFYDRRFLRLWRSDPAIKCAADRKTKKSAGCGLHSVPGPGIFYQYVLDEIYVKNRQPTGELSCGLFDKYQQRETDGSLHDNNVSFTGKRKICP